MTFCIKDRNLNIQNVKEVYIETQNKEYIASGILYSVENNSQEAVITVQTEDITPQIVNSNCYLTFISKINVARIIFSPLLSRI